MTLKRYRKYIVLQFSILFLDYGVLDSHWSLAMLSYVCLGLQLVADVEVLNHSDVKFEYGGGGWGKASNPLTQMQILAVSLAFLSRYRS